MANNADPSVKIAALRKFVGSYAQMCIILSLTAAIFV
jgi:hypothetical protein